MKKNVVGRVLYQKEPARGRLASLHIPARVLCLLLALIIWLTVSALNASAAASAELPADNTEIAMLV